PAGHEAVRELKFETIRETGIVCNVELKIDDPIVTRLSKTPIFIVIVIPATSKITATENCRFVTSDGQASDGPCRESDSAIFPLVLILNLVNSVSKRPQIDINL